MATFETVVLELKELNGYADLQLDADLESQDIQRSLIEINRNQLDALGEISQALYTILNQLPEALVSGFDSIVNNDNRIFNEETRAAANRQKLEDREGDDEEPTPTKDGGGPKGFFASNFAKGKKEGLDGSAFKGITDMIADITQTVGVFAGTAQKVFGVLRTAVMGLIGSITLPMVLIAGAITAITMGIMNFIEDFQSQEGGLFNQIVAGLGGFVDGFLKIVTIPLDWVKSILSSALELFGFDGAAQVLDSFSFTDMIDGLTDSLVEFIIGLKDMIVDGVKGIGKGIMSFFGFGGDDEEEAAAAKEEKKDPFAVERVETEGRIDGTAVLAGDDRRETEGRIDGTAVLAGRSGGEKPSAPTRTYTDEEMQTVRKITQPKKTEPARSSVSVKTSAPPPTPAPAPQKVSGGEEPNEYVTIDPVSGKYRAFAPNLAATGGEAYKLFDNVKDANEYTKSVDPEYEAKMAAELAAFDAEFGTAPTASAVGSATKEPGTIATALQTPEVRGVARDMVREHSGLKNVHADRITDAAFGAVEDFTEGGDVVGGLMDAGAEALGIDKPSVVGTGQESTLTSAALTSAQAASEAMVAEKGAGTTVIAPSNNSTNVTTTNIRTGEVPSPFDKGDRSARHSYRGKQI